MQVEKYTTNKGKDGIIADGYKYRLDKAFKNTNLWRYTQTLTCVSSLDLGSFWLCSSNSVDYLPYC
jgi:hypothetical protein